MILQDHYKGVVYLSPFHKIAFFVSPFVMFVLFYLHEQEQLLLNVKAFIDRSKQKAVTSYMQKWEKMTPHIKQRCMGENSDKNIT